MSFLSKWWPGRTQRGEDPPVDVAEILRQCAHMHAPVTILVYNPHSVIFGRVGALLADGVDIEIFGVPPSMSLAGALCCVSFSYAGRSGCFLAPIRKLSRGEPVRMVVEAPEEAILVDARRSVRVPVTGSEVVVRVSLADQSWTPQVADISVGGMGVTFGDHAPVVSAGTRLRVDLKCGGELVSRAALLLRKGEANWGLSFVDAGDHDDIDDPLIRIVTELNDRWQRRLGGKSGRH